MDDVSLIGSNFLVWTLELKYSSQFSVVKTFSNRFLNNFYLKLGLIKLRNLPLFARFGSVFLKLSFTFELETKHTLISSYLIFQTSNSNQFKSPLLSKYR